MQAIGSNGGASSITIISTLVGALGQGLSNRIYSIDSPYGMAAYEAQGKGALISWGSDSYLNPYYFGKLNTALSHLQAYISTSVDDPSPTIVVEKFVNDINSVELRELFRAMLPYLLDFIWELHNLMDIYYWGVGLPYAMEFDFFKYFKCRIDKSGKILGFKHEPIQWAHYEAELEAIRKYLILLSCIGYHIRFHIISQHSTWEYIGDDVMDVGLKEQVEILMGRQGFVELRMKERSRFMSLYKEKIYSGSKKNEFLVNTL